MSIESAKSFIERMKTDEEFAKKIMECGDPEGRMALVKERGYDFTSEEVMQVKQELSDDELGEVVGGSVEGACGIAYGSRGRCELSK